MSIPIGERLRLAAMYNVIVFSVFLVIYYVLGFNETHFLTSDKANVPTWFGPFYYCVQTHARLAYGDVVSRSQIVRVLTCLHIVLSFGNVLFFVV